MRKQRLLTLLGILSFTLSSVAIDQKQSFNITGFIEGLKNGENLFILIKMGDKIDTVSQAQAKNETFTFKNVILPARLGPYWVNIETEFVENLPLFLDQAGDVKIKGDLKTWPKVELIGAKAHNSYLAFLKDEKIVNKKVDSIRMLSDSSSRYNKRRQEARQMRLQFINSLSSSDLLPYALLMWKDFGGRFGDEELHPSVKRPYYNRLSNTLKNSFYGLRLKEILDKAEQANFMKPGDVFPKLSVFDEEGKLVEIADLLKKNKLTLIDCWHSMCKPCRKAFPSIKQTLAKYKDKGFGVVGISSDDDLSAWKKALDHDKLSWPNYIQDGKSLSKKFDLYGLGAYFLVDREGRVLAFDGPSKIMKSFGGGLSYEELDRKLEELLGK